jgi:Methane oxygenase PmoA
MKRNTALLFGLAFTLLLLIHSSLNAQQAGFLLEEDSDGVSVKIEGKLFTKYQKLSGTKPILWPILGPDDIEMTRPFPMEVRESEPNQRDHVHHRSLWLTHGNVNGVSFWDEHKNHGTIKHTGFQKIESGTVGTLIATSDWIGPDGLTVCQDESRLTFSLKEDIRCIEFDVRIFSNDHDVVFGDTKEGSFGIRVPVSWAVDEKLGGKILNSRGEEDGMAWGKPAEWVDYSGLTAGKTYGIAILNHPSSYGFPTHWHVRTYGLFAANPFGLSDFYGKEAGKNGSLKIGKGESLRLGYAVLFHRGSAQEAKVAEIFKEYSQKANETR